jgi:protease-4
MRKLWICRLAPMLLLVALLATGCITIDVGGGGGGKLEETVVQGDEGPKILMLEIDGEITHSNRSGVLGWFTEESTVARVRDQLERARGDKNIAALLLRLDSPGGSVTASDLVHDEIARFKHERGIPVLAQLMSTATSGAYYVAMTADEIVANRTTVTGSIGVILLGINLSGLMDKLGIEDQTFTSASYKDAGSPLRPMSPAERTQLQSVVDSLYERFVQVVVAGRPALGEEDVRRLADGRIYSAQQALDAGLVDALGTLDDSVERLRLRLGSEQVRVVSYHRSREWRSNLYSADAPPARFDAKPDALEILRPQPGFHYIWWPGVR